LLVLNQTMRGTAILQSACGYFWAPKGVSWLAIGRMGSSGSREVNSTSRCVITSRVRSFPHAYLLFTHNRPDHLDCRRQSFLCNSATPNQTIGSSFPSRICRRLQVGAGCIPLSATVE